MWNNTDVPAGYLITFRSYGTWMHGDERGSIDRFHNRHKSHYMPPNQKWLEYNMLTLKGDPVVLNDIQRKSVDKAVRETCEIRNLRLWAINVRTNHAHTVVSIGPKKPEVALNAFKANATRQMRADGCWTRSHSPWADKGSKRRLWTERSIDRAINYVINEQGEDPPDFEDE
ncbi:MAG: hypothetical protein QOJ64_3278 [Acidobacteriota bacterium]|nr:hypothetical protein [Acidobacteriota bacterium]